MSSPAVIQWALDTRPLWPSATETKDLPTAAARAIALLTPDERASVLRYHFLKDAKLALASILLKRLAIAQYCHVPWSAATPVRDERTKPVFLLPGSDAQPLRFNVSHQAGLVVLFAVRDPDGADSERGAVVGVDVACPSERRDRDLSMISTDGWSRFVAIHDEVFSPGETAWLEGLRAEAYADGWDGPLGYFYALWCLREAYVKMTGEALVASWLRELDLRGFAPPQKGEEHGAGGRNGLEIWFRGDKVEDVDVRMSWLLNEYMVCTAVKRGEDGRSVDVGPFDMLDIDELLDQAEKTR